MTRPRKQTVDYFPHSCSHGKTMHILEQKWGNTGYAFWFKLLELLGKTEGHYLDYGNPMTANYLQACTHTDEKVALEILEMLVMVEAIDKELWTQKVIWCQNFVDNLADLYSRRKIELPTRAAIIFGCNPNREMDDSIRQQEWCREATRKAVESGAIEKGCCEICLAGEVDAHHMDYSNPFSITWLCHSHHSEWHYREKIARLEGLMLTETHLREFITDRKLQSKVKESKGKETKGKDIPSKPPKKLKPVETPLPDDFAISESVKTWAANKGFAHLEDHLEVFKDYALARGKTYADWDSAFKKAIREDWAKVRGNGQGQRLPALLISKADQVTMQNLAVRDRLHKKYQEQGE